MRATKLAVVLTEPTSSESRPKDSCKTVTALCVGATYLNLMEEYLFSNFSSASTSEIILLIRDVLPVPPFPIIPIILFHIPIGIIPEYFFERGSLKLMLSVPISSLFLRRSLIKYLIIL